MFVISLTMARRRRRWARWRRRWGRALRRPSVIAGLALGLLILGALAFAWFAWRPTPSASRPSSSALFATWAGPVRQAVWTAQGARLLVGSRVVWDPMAPWPNTRTASLAVPLPAGLVHTVVHLRVMTRGSVGAYERALGEPPSADASVSERSLPALPWLVALAQGPTPSWPPPPARSIPIRAPGSFLPR